VPALDLAFAARDADLGSLVKSPLPEGLTLSQGQAVGPPRIAPSGGCGGCATTGSETGSGAVLAALAGFIWLRVRRRRS
jgi:MYXO-CTERM domain-containing protein